MKRLTLKEVLAGYRMRDEIRICIKDNTLIFCGTVMRFHRKCIFGRFSNYMNYQVMDVHEGEDGILYSVFLIRRCIMMHEKIIEAFNEVYGKSYKSFKIIKSKYPVTDILDTWLEYEVIIGYTRNIIDLLGECGINIEE